MKVVVEGRKRTVKREGKKKRMRKMNTETNGDDRCRK